MHVGIRVRGSRDVPLPLVMTLGPSGARSDSHVRFARFPRARNDDVSAESRLVGTNSSRSGWVKGQMFQCDLTRSPHPRPLPVFTLAARADAALGFRVSLRSSVQASAIIS